MRCCPMEALNGEGCDCFAASSLDADVVDEGSHRLEAAFQHNKSDECPFVLDAPGGGDEQ